MTALSPVMMAELEFIPAVLCILAAIILQRRLYARMGKSAYALFCAGTTMVCIAGIFRAVYKLLYAMWICDFARLNQSFLPMQAVGFLLAGLASTGLWMFQPKKKPEAAPETAAPAEEPAVPEPEVTAAPVQESFQAPVEADLPEEPAAPSLTFDEPAAETPAEPAAETAPQETEDGSFRLYTAAPVAAAPALFPGTFVFLGAEILGLAGLCAGLASETARRGRKVARVFFALAFVLLLAAGYLLTREFTTQLMIWISYGVNAGGYLMLLLGAITMGRDKT